ncbi:MAG: IPTL-CTERM sorting domain-containing protein, partial [Thiohalomonadaceae bacterium]
FSITDGGLGDDDLTANGIIVDQGGPGVPGGGGAAPIPTLSEWALILLAGMMGLFGVSAMRQRKHSTAP